MTITVHPVALGQVSLPDVHPRAENGTCPIIVHVVEHPDGLIVVDTGPRTGHPLIDEWYAPQVRSIIEAINGLGFDERSVVTLVNSHLHFDHCGQNHLLPSAEVWVTAEELTAAETIEHYTVPEWAAIDERRRRLSSDGELIAPGVRILHTPGHTPGHQSVSVEVDDGVELIAGQACYGCTEFDAAEPVVSDLHDESWLDTGRASLDRLRRLDPIRTHFAHDPTVRYRPERPS